MCDRNKLIVRPTDRERFHYPQRPQKHTKTQTQTQKTPSRATCPPNPHQSMPCRECVRAPFDGLERFVVGHTTHITHARTQTHTGKKTFHHLSPDTGRAHAPRVNPHREPALMWYTLLPYGINIDCNRLQSCITNPRAPARSPPRTRTHARTHNKPPSARQYITMSARRAAARSAVDASA